MSTNTRLDQSWTFWYHSINTNDWSNSSYKKLLEIQTVFDVKLLLDIIQREHFHNCLFFVMKEGIFPNWEDKHNRDGSCISLKIPKKHIHDTWNTAFLKLVTKSLFLDKYKQTHMNGISITPKKEFNILKLWFQKNIKNLKGISESKPFLQNKHFMYKKNVPDS